MKWFAGGVVLVAQLGSSPSAQLADFDARRAEARAGFVKELEAYAGWCQAKNLFQQKKAALELVLELAPDHAEAHKALGHVRAKDGSWKPPAKPKSFRDFDKQALAEAPGRFEAACAGYLKALGSLLDAPGLSVEQRDLAAADVLRLAPDDEHVHAVLGEVRSQQGWVLPETPRGKENRELLRNTVKEALERAPKAEPVPLTDREKRIPLRLEALAAPRLRVVGTVDEEEQRLAAKAVQALETLLKAVFSSAYALPADSTVFLLGDPKESAALIEHHPAIPEKERAYYLALEGSGIQGTNDFAFWTGDAQRRIDGTVRLVLGYWLSGAFDVGIEHGWIYEGFGLFLTRALVRTRMTWVAQPSEALAPEELALRQRLLDPESNWMDEAHQVLLAGHQTPLGELFKKGASELTTEDVLLSYALATYLLEARPEVVPDLFERIGGGRARAQAFQEAVGTDLASFEKRLTRWLGERK